MSQAQQRWQQIINEELIKGPWTAEEDQKVQLHPNTAVHCKMDGERKRRSFPLPNDHIRVKKKKKKVLLEDVRFPMEHPIQFHQNKNKHPFIHSR